MVQLDWLKLESSCDMQYNTNTSTHQSVVITDQKYNYQYK